MGVAPQALSQSEALSCHVSPPLPGQVLDAASGVPRWAAGQHPLGIYPYTPTLLGDGAAAAVRNCLDTLASNSLCIYSQAPQELPAPADDGQAEAASAPTSGVPLATGGWPLLGQLGGPAATATARLLLVAAAGAALILLF